MSVIIKDMEMPKTCSKCEIWSKCWDERPFWFERLECCPLTEKADRKTEPQYSEDDMYWLSLAEDVANGKMSDAGANQAWFEYINRKTEPQTNADQHVQHVESVKDETGRWVRVGQWEWEHHTDTTHFGKVKGESITTNKVEDEPQTETVQGTGDCEHCSRLFVDCDGR